jgi:hypothetical protein
MRPAVNNTQKREKRLPGMEAEHCVLRFLWKEDSFLPSRPTQLLLAISFHQWVSSEARNIIQNFWTVFPAVLWVWVD